MITQVYGELAKLFSFLSLSAFGGGKVVLPSIHQAAVDQYHWMTNKQFLDLFSISQAAPGPSTLIVELVAIKAAGFPEHELFSFLPAVIGSLTAILAMFLPSSLLLLFVFQYWKKIQGTAWQSTFQKALMPITAALILEVTWIVAKEAMNGWMTLMIGIVSFLLILCTKITPILIMALAALASWFF